MTIWAEGSGRYMNERRFRIITVREFVRRFRRGVAHNEQSFVWLLGAGCSASSGVPTADQAVRGWLKDLKYLETGEDGDLDGWAAKRLVGYNPDDPAAVYGQVLAELFHTDQEKRIAISRLLASAEPGFGYATLAQLMTHPKWGQRTSLAITTNFDDLCADALHVYSQRRPQTLTCESVNHMTQLGLDSPTVVKLFGDAHLPGLDRKNNRPVLDDVVKERLGEQIAEAGLIIVGYGGRDELVLDLLESLPANAPASGLYWVNAEAPSGAFGDLLESRNATWVEHQDFDELMYFVRLEFGLGHPTIGRFERVFRKYNAQYRELSTRAGLELGDRDKSETPSIARPRGALPGDGGDGIDLRSIGPGQGRRETEEERRERMRRSLSAYKRAIAESAPEGDGGGGGESGPPRQINVDPIEPARDPEDGRGAGRSAVRRLGVSNPVDDLLHGAVSELHGRGGNRADLGRETAKDAPPAERRGQRRFAGDAMSGAVRGSTAPAAGDAASDAPQDPPPPAERGPTRSTEIEDVLRRIELPGRPRRSRLRDGLRDGQQRRDGGPVSLFGPAPDISYGDEDDFSIAPIERPAEPLHLLPEDEAEVIQDEIDGALRQNPDDVALLARRARFMSVARGDLSAAEADYERAHQLQPKNIALLREYAIFALERLRDFARAERLLTRALNMDLRNSETLLALAKFLLRARGDLEEAENCLRLAIEVGADNPAAWIAYAHFLNDRRGRKDAAEAQLRRAGELAPPSSQALAELALFRARGPSLDSAAQALAQAERVAPDAARTWWAIAAIEARKGDATSADKAYREALEADPSLSRARLDYARILEMRDEEIDEAEHQYREAIALAPQEGAPWAEYGRFLRVARRDMGRAEPFIRRARDCDPFDPTVLTLYAEHLAAKDGMLDEADGFFRDALTFAPGASDIRRAYGRFLASVKRDADAAEEQFRRAVDIDPGDAGALDELAQFLHAVRSDAEEAEVYFREALKVAPNQSETLHRFAAFLRDTRRDVGEVERYYRRALDNNPKDAQTLARAAQFLLAQGRRQEGLKVLNECFDAAWRMDPESRPATMMLELWIYRYAFDMARMEQSLDAALGLIESGVRCDGWDLEAPIEEAVRQRHPDPEMLRDLLRVATEGDDPSILRRRRR